MQNIMLKQLSLDMGKSEYNMLQGISAVENGFTNPAYNLSYDEYKEWLRITDNNSRGIDLPEDWIPYTTYVLYIDDIPVGYGRVRHSSSEYLETVVGAGNLGYGIAKEYRGKSHAVPNLWLGCEELCQGFETVYEEKALREEGEADCKLRTASFLFVRLLYSCREVPGNFHNA